MPSLSSDLPSVPPTVEPKAEKETSPPQEVPKSTSPAAKDNQDDERTREVLRGALNKLASTEARSRVSMSSLPENPWDNPKWEPSPWENEPENTGLTPQLEEKKENAPSLPVLEKQDPVTLTLTSQVFTAHDVYTTDSGNNGWHNAVTSASRHLMVWIP